MNQCGAKIHVYFLRKSFLSWLAHGCFMWHGVPSLLTAVYGLIDICQQFTQIILSSNPDCVILRGLERIFRKNQLVSIILWPNRFPNVCIQHPTSGSGVTSSFKAIFINKGCWCFCESDKTRTSYYACTIHEITGIVQNSIHKFNSRLLFWVINIF